MADEKNTDRNSSADEATAKQAGTQPPRGDVKEGRGGEQTDQISGETGKGAHNEEMKGKNPQGNKPDRNERAR